MKNITTTKVNRDFLIRYTTNDVKQSKFITASQYIALIGDVLAFKHFSQAFDKGLDKYTVKLRRGLKTDFYSK